MHKFTPYSNETRYFAENIIQIVMRCKYAIWLQNIIKKHKHSGGEYAGEDVKLLAML